MAQAFTRSLTAQHRALEPGLDQLAAAIAGGNPEAAFRAFFPQLRAHYRTEEPFLANLRDWHPALGGKMAAQHAEACEIASALEDAIAAGHRRDILLLARRFCAIVAHNMIEEERDVFPLADRN